MDAEPGARGSSFKRGPVRDPQDFYGRTAETASVLDLLSRAQNCSVTGPSRIGKSSLLLHLARPETWRAHGLDRDQYARVYVSCRGLLNWPAEEIFHALALETLQAVMTEPFAGPLQVPRGPFPLHYLRRFLWGLTRRGGKVIWLLDDVDLLPDNPHLDFGFFSDLGVLAAEPWLGVVTASRLPIHETSVDDRQLEPLLADVFTPVPLGLLGRDEALAMVRDLSSRLGPDLERFWPEMEALTATHALGLRILCDIIVRRGRVPGQDEWPAIAASFCDEMEPFLMLAWTLRRPEERRVLIQLARGNPPGTEVAVLHALERSTHLVVRDNGGWRLNCDVIRDFVLRQADMTDAERADATERAVRSYSVQYPDGEDALPRVVRALSRTAEAHHQWPEGDPVPRLAMWVAGELGCDGATICETRVAARLRDIGHIATPEEILHKPGPLTPQEWEVVRAHPVVGIQILDSLELPPQVKPAVRWHHEREDGSGYPDGLVACEIPLVARILAVADAYAAMTADRPYRPAMSSAEALETLKGAADAYLDPAVAALEKVVARQEATA